MPLYFIFKFEIREGLRFADLFLSLSDCSSAPKENLQEHLQWSMFQWVSPSVLGWGRLPCCMPLYTKRSGQTMCTNSHKDTQTLPCTYVCWVELVLFVVLKSLLFSICEISHTNRSIRFVVLLFFIIRHKNNTVGFKKLKHIE